MMMMTLMMLTSIRIDDDNNGDDNVGALVVSSPVILCGLFWDGHSGIFGRILWALHSRATLQLGGWAGIIYGSSCGMYILGMEGVETQRYSAKSGGGIYRDRETRPKHRKRTRCFRTLSRRPPTCNRA